MFLAPAMESTKRKEESYNAACGISDSKVWLPLKYLYQIMWLPDIQIDKQMLDKMINGQLAAGKRANSFWQLRP